MTALPLAAALLLDAAWGEPRWLWSRVPHPAVLMGRAVAWLDARLNHASSRRARGIVAMLVLAGAAGGSGLLLAGLGPIAEAVVAAILLAQRSLADHVAAVANALRLSTAEARRAVAHIVGRDTAAMDTGDIVRAAIESAAENFSDGVVAPAFWFLVAGLPGLLVYKAINTADSMIGYRTPRHAAFGWAAARFDDVLNWIPARLTAVLIWLTRGRPAAWSAIRRDARRHRSPNAGWPEAAMAAALDLALAGPRSYDGRRQSFPYVHPKGRRDGDAADIDAAVRVLWHGWGAGLAAVILMAFLWG